MQFNSIITQDRMTELLGPVDALVDECKIHANDDGPRITAVDPANVGMVDVQFQPDGFESYETDEPILGVNLIRLMDILSAADSDDLLNFDLIAESRQLHIEHNGLEYFLALIDPDSIREEPDIPDLDLPVHATISTEAFDRGVKAADMVSDHIEIGSRAGEETVYFRAEGDTDDVDYEVQDDDLLSPPEAGEAAMSIFSLDYLLDMNKGIPDGSEISLRLGDEFPVMIDFPLSGGHGDATYMLAPRIQSN